MSKHGDDTLQLVKVSSSHSSKENNGVLWESVPDLLDLPTKPFNLSTSLESPCLSESGSDIYTKREVIQKLRQQLKRRDDMIEEMQAQIAALQNSLTVEMAHITHLQAQLDSSNRELMLRKAISNQFSCEFDFDGVEKTGEDRIEMLNRELKGLKEVAEGKDFLIQSYKEQKMELCSKMRELQLRFVSQALS